MKRYLLAAAIAAVPAVASAEVTISFYSGYQDAAPSTVSGRDPAADGGNPYSFSANWEGKSFAAPPYYGIRGIWWRDDRWGFGLEVTHDKIYADKATKADNGYTTLEFTDGLNTVTVDAIYRWPDRWGKFTPYVGGGIGIAVPHVEVVKGSVSVHEYQYTGPAVRWMAGAQYAINDRWSVFGEYQGTYSWNSADLGDGGTLDTDIATSAFNIGVSYSF